MSSNIVFLSDTISKEGGYSLPEGASWNVKIKNGKKEGNAEVIDKYGTQIADLSYKNDMLNGECTFFEYGTIAKTVTYIDNVAEGWSYEYEGGEESKCFLYKKGFKMVELQKCENKNGYWNEIEVGSNKRISCSHYNSHHEKDGVCYDFENEVVCRAVLFESGRELSEVKLFSKTSMKEYDKDGNLIYEGGYLDSIQLDYPRDGEGIELLDGKRVYEGHWKNNMKNGFGVKMKDNLAYYSGQWMDNVPHGEGRIMGKGKVLFKGEFKKGILDIGEGECYDFFLGKIVEMKEKVVEVEMKEIKPKQNKPVRDLSVFVTNEKEWLDISEEITELTVGEDVCNQLNGEVSLIGYRNLKRFSVNKKSFMKANKLHIRDCDNLEYLSFELGTFFLDDCCFQNHRVSNYPFENVIFVELVSMIY